MPLSVYLGAAAIMMVIPLTWWAFSGSSPSSRARALIAPGESAPEVAGLRARASWLHGGTNWLASRLASLSSAPELERRIGQAGLNARWTVERVVILKVVMATAAALGGAIWATTSSFGYAWAVVLLGVIVAFGLPDARIAEIARTRQRRIELQLPDLLDKLTITIEAGLGFDSALARVVSNGRGPVYDEFRWVLQDLQLGLPRESALQALAARSTVDDLKLFVSAVTQSGKYGLPLGAVMRTEAAELRDKRRQRAEERAMKVPVKILMPLIFCVLPALFIVVIGPGIIRISRSGLLN